MLTVASPDSKGRFGFALDGAPPVRSAFNSVWSRNALAKSLGFAESWIAAVLRDFILTQGDPPRAMTKDYDPAWKPPQPVEVPLPPVAVRVRGRTQSSPTATQCATFEDALRLETLPDEAMIEWQGTDRLAALDVDFHSLPLESRPDVEQLDAFTCEPCPAWYWLTRGRGLRFMFEASGKFTAAEIASVAALSIRRWWPPATFEVKPATRHPHSTRDGSRCGPVRHGGGRVNLDHLHSRLTDMATSDEAITIWLDERGLRRGQRYPHTQCVMNPSTQGGRDPVFVDPDYGIYCHYCAATTGRGWTTYQRLCGDASLSLLGAMVRGYVHWGHASHVLSGLLDLDGPVARGCYSAALKLVHEDEDRAKRCFDPTLHMLRLEGYWATGDGHALNAQIRGMVAKLPACEDGAKIDEFLQSTPLARHGYFALSPIRGCRVASIHQRSREPDAGIDVVMYPPLLQPPHMESFRPRYVPAPMRGEAEKAWRLIETVFPGLTRPLIELLIAAKGAAEVPVGLPPMIYISGPTGAAKTASVYVAAAICGDSATDVVWTPNRERVRQGVMDSKSTGSYCVFNEVLKEGKDAGKKSVATMDFVLNLSGGSTSHKLFVGHVPLGRLPVFVWTDTDLPDDLARDSQLARRLTWVGLTSFVDWQTSLRNSGVNDPKRLRVAGEHYAEACNVVLSDVIDRFFREPMTFTEIATQLGYSTVLDADHGDTGKTLRAFFDAVCDAPEVTAIADVKRIGPAWRVLMPQHESPLMELWEEVRDVEDFTASRLCKSQDWQRVLRTSQPVEFQVKNHGRRLFIRFRGGDGRFNRELLDAVRVGPLESGAYRLGDTIDSRHFDGFPKVHR